MRGGFQVKVEREIPVNAMMRFVAQTTDVHEIKQGYGSLIFTGAFFLVLIIIGIWWLKRSV